MVQVFEAAISWVLTSAEERRTALPEILAAIRLPLLRPHYITDVVASNPLIRDDLRWDCAVPVGPSETWGLGCAGAVT